jgi:hypothetical protein
MLKGVCPIVVDHMLRMTAAWKNSIDCGTSSKCAESKVLDSWKSRGASVDAESCVVWRTAIKQQAQRRRGDFLTSARMVSDELPGLKETQRP